MRHGWFAAARSGDPGCATHPERIGTTAMYDSTPPGWYRSPNEQGAERFFDGTQWTDDRRPAGQPSAPDAPAGKQKKALWKRKWVWALAAIVAIAVVASSGGSPDDPADETAQDVATDADEPAEPGDDEEPTDADNAPPASGQVEIGDIGDMGNDHVGRVNAITADVAALNEFATVPAGMTITRADVEVCAGSRELNVNPLY